MIAADGFPSLISHLHQHGAFSVAEQSEQISSLTRRVFLIRAGEFGVALSIFPPSLRGMLRPIALEPTSPKTLSHGVLSAPVSPDLYSGLRWRMLGPFRGGAVAAATGVPGRPNEFYFGAVNGGVWKTIDGGRIWNPVFDGQPTSSIGAIGVSSADP